jgi:hypothetical protein
MLDFRRTLWALWLGVAVVGRLVHTPVVLAVKRTMAPCADTVMPKV